jgi:hypothetical protein
MVGIAGPIVGVLLLHKSHYARPSYLAFLALGLTVPYLLFGAPLMSLAGVVAICVAAAYLYKVPSAQQYFAP